MNRFNNDGGENVTRKKFEIQPLPETFYPAPDGSQIRVLPTMTGGGLAHCTLEVGQISRAVAHKSIEEIWYFIEGHGKLWLKQDEQEDMIDIYPHLSITIPAGTHFQFRNTGPFPLRFLIVTMPPWPGESEAYPVKGFWSVAE